MQLDTPTLMVLGGLVMLLCGVSFILNSSFNRNDPSGRLWSVAFIGGITVAVAFGINAFDPAMWWVIIVGNVALVMAIGSLWSGNRLYNGRHSAYWAVGAVAVIVGIVTVAEGPEGNEWAGVLVLWAALGILGGLGGSETLRGRLRRNLNGRILGVVLWIAALFSTARAVMFVVNGPGGPIFTAYFNAGSAAILYPSLVVTATIAMSILRAERTAGNAVGDLTVGIHSAAGVLSATAFAQAAADHLDRAAASQSGLALIGADIDKLPEFNTVFGRAAGDQAIARFAQTLRHTAPMMALIGHPAAGRFFVLASVASATEALTITERIQTALVDDPSTDSSQIRMTASFGIADSYDHGRDLAALTKAVNAATGIVKEAGGNGIEVGSASV